MAILDSVKGAFVKAALDRMTHGDSGSTVLGIVAGSLLAANLDFGKLLTGFRTQESAMECGKAAAIVFLAVWGYFVGKK